jgi:TM2 domain-containing membrane protein YozV
MNKDRILTCLVVLSIFFVDINAQSVAINTDGSNPNSSAVLDLKSSTMGLLVPRMSTAQVAAFGGALTPAEAGMLVYDTDSSHFFFWDGAAFKVMSGTSILSDNDGDTRVNVEESTDEDNIRFDLAGTERWVMTGRRLEPRNSGGSVYVGEDAGASDTLSNDGNIAIGRSALYNNTDQGGLVAIGDSALFNNSIGATDPIQATENTALGSKSLISNTVGFSNTAAGYRAMFRNTSGWRNTAVGYEALFSNIDGYRNMAGGYKAMHSNTSGLYNTATGYLALAGNMSGSGNTAAGYFVMSSNLTGDDNTAIGKDALSENTSGNSNTAIGVSADVGFDSLMNATAIGANTIVNQNNSLVLGNNANVGIGTSSPGAHKLYVTSAGAGAGGSTGYFRNTTSGGIALSVENLSYSSSDVALLVTNRGSTDDIAVFDTYNGSPGGWNRRFRFTNAGEGMCDGSWTATGADYAEFFPMADPEILYYPGDVISMSGEIGYSVEAADANNPNLILGVYSSNPALVGNAPLEEDPKDAVLVGLMGVIPTKVSNENGPIQIGDFLTISSTPGVAMKAIKSGLVIGRAIEDYNGSETGMIKVYVEVDWVQIDDIESELKAIRIELADNEKRMRYLQSEIEELKSHLLNTAEIK